MSAPTHEPSLAHPSGALAVSRIIYRASRLPRGHRHKAQYQAVNKCRTSAQAVALQTQVAGHTKSPWVRLRASTTSMRCASLTISKVAQGRSDQWGRDAN